MMNSQDEMTLLQYQNSTIDDYEDAMNLLNKLIQVDTYVDSTTNLVFILLLSSLGTLLNIFTLIISVLMLRSLFKSSSSSNQSQQANVSIKRKHLRGKSRLMEYYLIEIIIFDLIMSFYLVFDSAFIIHNRSNNKQRQLMDGGGGDIINVMHNQSLEDLSNFCCKAFIYMQKVCSLMSCWLIVCFAMNRICLLISGRYTYLPLVIYDEESNCTTAADANQQHTERLRSNSISTTQSTSSNSFKQLKHKSSMLSMYSHIGPCSNFKFVINSKKSTLVLFLIFALINIYLIEITGLVDVTSQMPINDTSNTLQHSEFPLQEHLQQHCGSTNLENKSVLALHITIFHIFGFLIPYVVTLISLYYLIKNLYKLKMRINTIILRKSHPLFIRSNELIFYRTSLTAIFLCVFYILTTLPYNLVSIITIIDKNNPRIVIALNYVEYIKYLNHSVKFFIIYYSNTRFRKKADCLLKRLFKCVSCFSRARHVGGVNGDDDGDNTKYHKLSRQRQLTLNIVDSAALLTSIQHKRHRRSGSGDHLSEIKRVSNGSDIETVPNSQTASNSTILLKQRDLHKLKAINYNNNHKTKLMDFGDFYDDLCQYYQQNINNNMKCRENKTTNGAAAVVDESDALTNEVSFSIFENYSPQKSNGEKFAQTSL